MSSEELTLEKFIGFCKRRGFVFQSSEIYGGLAGFFDFGPLGVELRRNLKDAWWQDFVQRRTDVEGIETSIIMHPKVWEASGHVGGFSDPMVDCKESKLRYRADQLFWGAVRVQKAESAEAETIGYVSLLEDAEEKMQKDADAAALKMKKKLSVQGELNPVELKDYTECPEELFEKIPSPATGKPGSLTPPRDFNLMFETQVGALEGASSTAYLRPETAQGIFVNFKNVADVARAKLPFGIAQIGKSFRNEITPRNFIFRVRELEQMELEYFIAPNANWQAIYREWIDTCKQWLVNIGVDAASISEDEHAPEKLSHYSKGTTDLMFKYPFGVQELWGVACRGDFDLTQHQTHSGKSLEYFDETGGPEGKGEKFIPHVVEPALGVDRLMLAVLCSAYAEEEVPPANPGGKTEMRTVLKLHPRIAPYKAAIFPLLKNKPQLVERARALHSKLLNRWNVFYDEAGAIGRRYRRQDEIGTPFCITIDFETIEDDGCITIRNRDTLEQVRIPEDDVEAWLAKHLT